MPYYSNMKSVLSDKKTFEKVFTLPLGLSKFDGLKGFLRHGILWTIRDAILEYPVIRSNDDKSKILFVNAMPVSIKSNRKDYAESFNKVRNLAANHDAVYFAEINSEKGQIGRILERISIKKFFKCAASVPSFSKIAKNSGISLRKSIYCLPEWFNICSFFDSCREIDFNKYKLVVVFCDAEPRQSALIQLAKRNGCKTATLQHGLFCAPMKNAANVEEDGIEFRGSTSDYFLAWNGLSQSYAVQSGIPAERVKVVGNPKFIGMRQKERKRNKTGFFGVVLGNYAFETDNKKLIEIANHIAKKLHMRYYLKYHPIVDESYYSDITDGNYYAGNVDKKANLDEYADTVDFSIVGQSSMTAELIYLGHPTFHLHIDEVKDKYDMLDAISFSDGDQLCELLKMPRTDDGEIAYLMAGPEDAETAYAQFFELFLE